MFAIVEAKRNSTGTVVREFHCKDSDWRGPNKVFYQIGQDACNRYSSDFEIVVRRITQFEFDEHVRRQDLDKRMIEKKTGVVFS